MADEIITRKLFGALNSEDIKEAELLLKEGANPNTVLPVEGVACMHIASGLGLEATKLLLSYGGDPNIRSVDGTTPMHVAATWGDQDSLRMLLTNGGDPLARDQDGSSCLDSAQTYGHTNCIHLLEFCMLLLSPDVDSSRQPNIIYKPCESSDDLHIETTTKCLSGRDRICLHPKDDPLYLDDFLEWAFHQEGSTYTDHINTHLRSCLTGHRNYSCDVTSPDHPFLEYKSQSRDSDISGQTDTNDLGFCQNSCHVHWADQLTKTLPWNSILDNSLTNSTDDDTFLSCSSGPSPTLTDTTPVNTQEQTTHQNTKNLAGQVSRESKSLNSQEYFRRLNRQSAGSPIENKSWNPSVKNVSGQSDVPQGQNISIKTSEKPPVRESGCLYRQYHTQGQKSSNSHDRYHGNGNNKSYGKSINEVRSQSGKLCDENNSCSVTVNRQYPNLPQEAEIFRKKDMTQQKQNNTDKISRQDSSIYGHNTPISSRKLNVTCGDCNKVRGEHAVNISPLQSLEKRKVRCERKVQNWLNSTSPQTLVDDMRKISLESKDIHTWEPPSTPVDQNASDLISMDESFCQRHPKKISNNHMSSLKESFNDSLLTDQDETIPYEYDARLESETQSSSQKATLTEGISDSLLVDSDDTLLCDDHMHEDHTSVTDCDILNQSFGQMSVDSGVTVEYVYRDPEEGIVLVERRIPSQCGSIGSNTQRLSLESTGTTQTLDSQATQVYDWKSLCRNSLRKSDASDLDEICSMKCEDIPQNLRSLSNDDIRSKLQSLGDNPGPVTPATRQTYLIRLKHVESDPQIVLTSKGPGYSTTLNVAIEGNYDNSLAAELETKMVAAFQNPRRTCRWREGTMKSSFNYLLLDPRVTRNLPNRSSSLSELDTFRTFVSAIFYVGKGKRARPYCHLYEAINQLKSPKAKASEKIERILDIWDSGEGVVSLHCFQSVIPVEAYTREACLVDAIGLSNLTNKKRGDYYGVSTMWSNKQRQQVGVLLLKKALQIFLGEGERQISPPDIKVGS
ncbi:LOW QUALITY PROTEIN: protein phosphatase 1 regulatory subunit 12A-like [Pecten maximus]|uniref:LOW QUALITY PROTEIN: protein phosphatase 1 regulatory subunit 12A-like n=1 Tax=Pecten maximus TaxID=6579 RepID=UPI001458A7FB|nr:LOW QUALITY PROTEIN: protein phosphatase 1 regulatory subunit 12A-like [Pecten maximus]